VKQSLLSQKPQDAAPIPQLTRDDADLSRSCGTARNIHRSRLGPSIVDSLRTATRPVLLAAIWLACPFYAFGSSPEEIAARAPVAEINVKEGVAVKGYDVVAYFTDRIPVKGSPEYMYQWKGATWQFASAEHRAAFVSNPEKYAPQYGGYCSYAISLGSVVDIDPKQWKIVGGRLYLNNNSIAQGLWLRDPEAHIKKGDFNWRLTPRHPL
jgi:YHS domain-containing protein